MATLVGYLLNVAYGALLVLLSPVIVWQAVRSGKYRAGYGAKLLGLVPESPRDGRPCVWLHAVSVGEVNLLATTLAELKQRRPEWRLVISTTTSTGYALAVKKYGAEHTVFYCPLDFTWAVRRAMQRVRPELLVLAELELWPNLIAAAKPPGPRWRSSTAGSVRKAIAGTGAASGSSGESCSRLIWWRCRMRRRFGGFWIWELSRKRRS